MNRKLRQKLQDLRDESYVRIRELINDGVDDLKLWGRMAAAEELLTGSPPEDLIYGTNHITPNGDYKTGFLEICNLFKGLI